MQLIQIRTSLSRCDMQHLQLCDSAMPNGRRYVEDHVAPSSLHDSCTGVCVTCLLQVKLLIRLHVCWDSVSGPMAVLRWRLLQNKATPTSIHLQYLYGR